MKGKQHWTDEQRRKFQATWKRKARRARQQPNGAATDFAAFMAAAWKVYKGGR